MPSCPIAMIMLLTTKEDIMTTAREIMDNGNKKRQEEEQAQLRNEYAALLQATNEKKHALYGTTQNDIEEKIEANFTEIHELLIKASEKAPLLSDMLKPIDNLCAEFKENILCEGQDGLMKIEALKNAVAATLNPEVQSDKKIKAIKTFESLSWSSLQESDRNKRSGFYYTSSIGLLIAGLALGLVVTGIIIATAGIGLAALAIGALVGGIVGGVTGATVGCAVKLDMPSSLGSRLKQVSKHGFFAATSTLAPKVDVAPTPRLSLV